jgi:hypothetical protein
MLDKLERWFGRFALPNVTLYIIVGQVFVALSTLLHLLDLKNFVLVPVLVVHGEAWRVLTFPFYPPPVNYSSLFSVAMLPFAWWIFFIMGNALEHHWGVFRYNLFLLAAWVLTIAAAFLTPLTILTNGYVGVTVFLAFAWLYPDFELMPFFIFTVRIKWLALLTCLYGAYCWIAGDWPTRWQIVAMVATLLLFFGRDLVQTLRYRRRKIVVRTKRMVEEKQPPAPRHRCHVCGRTDLTDPTLDFRYCSKCAGDQCYCPDHIFNHEHVLTDGGSPAKKS